MEELRKKFPDKFNESGQMDSKWFERDIRPFHFCYIRHDKNSITFTIQNGPIKYNGVNGCQVDTLIHTAKKMIEGLNEKFPSEYNEAAVIGLDIAIESLGARTRDREKRKVEGSNQA